jgi:hypothetical protein
VTFKPRRFNLYSVESPFYIAGANLLMPINYVHKLTSPKSWREQEFRNIPHHIMQIKTNRHYMLSDIAIYLQESKFSTLGTVGFEVRQSHGNTPKLCHGAT